MSVHGIRQLVSNGYEWTDGDTAVERTNLNAPPPDGVALRQTGTSYEIVYVLTFARIRTKPQRTEWLRTDEGAGFRVVLEPPLR